MFTGMDFFFGGGSTENYLIVGKTTVHSFVFSAQCMLLSLSINDILALRGTGLLSAHERNTSCPPAPAQ